VNFGKKTFKNWPNADLTVLNKQETNDDDNRLNSTNIHAMDETLKSFDVSALDYRFASSFPFLL